MKPTSAAELVSVLPSFPAKDLSCFRVESLLGGGGFSHVVLARDAAGAEWALKLIPAPDATCLGDVDASPLLLSEARLHLMLSRAGEPSVLPCMEAFKALYVNEGGTGGGGHGPAARRTYMAVLRMPVAACSVEEWLFSATPAPVACPGAAVGQVDEQEVLGVWVQMVNAVHRCHVHGVVHKDVKLPNFLMDSRGLVRIMDFGLAQLEGVTPRAVAGTPWTMSPAGFKHGDDGRAGDWWSLGIVLYQLLQGGAWPFKHCWWPWQRRGGAAMEAAIRRAVLAGHITFAGGGGGGGGRRLSEPIKALIRGLLQPDPNRRWQLRQVLASPAIGPELLSGLAARFPELARDIGELMALQRRARGLQALGSDGGAGGGERADGGAAAGGVAGGVAASVARGVAAAVAAAAEGGLHWPHWPAGGGRAHAADGAGASAYEPLLGEAEDGGGGGGAGNGGDAAAAAPPSQLSLQQRRLQRNQQHQQHQQHAARSGALTLLLPDELPPGDGRGGGAAAAGASLASPFTSGGAHSGHLHHSRTTPSLVGGTSNVSADPASASSPDLEGSGSPPPGLHPSPSDGLSSPRTRPHSRSLLHPRGDPTSPSGSRLRSSRTSLQGLHDLFSARPGGAPAAAPHGACGAAHQHPPQGAAAAAGGVGGLRGLLRRDSPPLQQLCPGERSGSFGGGSGGHEEEEAFRASQSSWVPPPPEAVAAGAGIIGGRPLSGRLSRLSGGSGAAAGAAAGGAPLERPSAQAAPWQAPTHGGQRGHGGGLLSRLRQLFTACLQRPGVKYALYDGDEYDTLSGP